MVNETRMVVGTHLNLLSENRMNRDRASDGLAPTTLEPMLRIGTPSLGPVAEKEAPLWFPLHLVENPEQFGMGHVFVLYVYGAPFPCVYRAYGPVLDGAPNQIVNLYTLQVRFDKPVRYWRDFPLRPILIGLVGNVIFYGALVATVWYLMRGTRRKIRELRGLCRQCGYARAGLERDTCPECGAAWRVASLKP